MGLFLVCFCLVLFFAGSWFGERKGGRITSARHFVPQNEDAVNRSHAPGKPVPCSSDTEVVGEEMDYFSLMPPGTV